jgi:hypothetical protein
LVRNKIEFLGEFANGGLSRSADAIAGGLTAENP